MQHQHTRSELRDMIASLGGDDHVAARLGVTVKTINYCYDQRAFTAQWFGPFCQMADEARVARPPLSMFGWRALAPADVVPATAEDAA